MTEKIKDELKRCKKSETLSLLSINVGRKSKNDDYNWKATFIGPKNTGYAGGLFKLLINVPKDYPNNPPEIRFKNKVFHPNVRFDEEKDEMGGYHICSDYLNKWNQDHCIESALTSIYQLMVCPTPEHGYSNEATNLLSQVNNDPFNEKYKSKCNEWVRKYSTVDND